VHASKNEGERLLEAQRLGQLFRVVRELREPDGDCGSRGRLQWNFIVCFLVVFATISILDVKNKRKNFYSLKLPGYLAIYDRVREIADAQTALREKLERRKWRALVGFKLSSRFFALKKIHFCRWFQVRKEWNRVFNRFDYFFLFLFSSMNVGALLFFLRFSWLPVPELPDDYLL
jgi:hypothetical protein